MTFYDEFKKDYQTRQGGPPPPPPSSPYLPYGDTDPVDPDAPTEARYPTSPPPPPPRPPTAGGSGDNRRNWGIVGAVILVLVVIIGVLVIHPSGTSSLAQGGTPTATITPLPTSNATATATAAPTATVIATCPAAPSTASGTLANIAAFFTIPGIPTGSVTYYRSSEDGEANHIQSRVLHVCSPTTPDQVTQAYANALSGWTSCGAQCYQTPFSYNGVTITKGVQVQSGQATGGITQYQLRLTLDATVTKTALTVAPQANIGFVSAAQQDATWLGNGQLQLAPNTFAAPTSACATTTYTYAQLHRLSYSGLTSPISISQDGTQPTIRCLKTANGGLIEFSAYYTSSDQQLVLTYAAYVAGFV